MRSVCAQRGVTRALTSTRSGGAEPSFGANALIRIATRQSWQPGTSARRPREDGRPNMDALRCGASPNADEIAGTCIWRVMPWLAELDCPTHQQMPSSEPSPPLDEIRTAATGNRTAVSVNRTPLMVRRLCFGLRPSETVAYRLLWRTGTLPWPRSLFVTCGAQLLVAERGGRVRQLIWTEQGLGTRFERTTTGGVQ
jgi:hypothetical protein